MKSSDRQEGIFNISIFTLSAISLLADILGLGKLAFDVVVEGNLDYLLFKVLILVLVFVFGAGLGIISIKGFRNTTLPMVAQFYAWVYVGITCLSYIGIALTLNQQQYTFGTYASFVLIVITELLALVGLHVVIDELDLDSFSIPILSVTLFHLVLVAYTYIFKGTPVSLYIAGDLFFFLGMTIVGSAMLGDIGFITMIRKIMERL